MRRVRSIRSEECVDDGLMEMRSCRLEWAAGYDYYETNIGRRLTAVLESKY